MQNNASNPHIYQEVRYGEIAYSSIQTHVVVDEARGRRACICW